MIRSALRWAAPGGARGGLSILIFHRVLPQIDPLFPDEPDVARFEQLMSWITRWFQVLPLDEAVARLGRGQLPPGAAAITFDDGYADNLLLAAPILKKWGATATFFIATGFLDGGRMWNDTVSESLRRTPAPTLDAGFLGLGVLPLGNVEQKRHALGRLLPAIKHLPGAERTDAVERLVEACAPGHLPDDLMLSSRQVRELRAQGMGIGAHTVHHPILTRCDDAEARREIADGRDTLASLLGETIPLFAYPNGKLHDDYAPRHADMARALGFKAAVSTDWGVSRPATDPFRLPRFTPWDRSRLRFGLRLLGNCMTATPASSTEHPGSASIKTSSETGAPQSDKGTPPAIQNLPKISVIIPAYNAERFILEALASVRAQAYPHLEILIIDDGSQDGTAARVEQHAPEVLLIRQANAGAAAARNTGLSRASGDFLCFLDADDGWFPGKLAAQAEYLTRHPETGVVGHAWHVWHPQADGSYLPPEAPQAQGTAADPEISGWIYHQLLLSCNVHTSTVMMRREVFERIGRFKTTLVTGEDYDYWLRVSREFKIDRLAGVYSFYRAVPGSLSRKPSEKNNEYEVLMKALEQWGETSPDGQRPSAEQLKQRLFKLAFGFGYAHYHTGSALLARKAFAQALKHDPWQWRAWVYQLLSALKDREG